MRLDKNEFFDGFFSPRGSLVYTLGEKKNHNIRGSVQQGFRNPTTQDLFIGLNAGRAILVGSAPNNLDRYRSSPVLLSTKGRLLTGQTTTTLSGRDAYENAYSRNSIDAGNPTVVNTPLVKPEEITAYEVGYRAQMGKVAVDLSGYYNKYKNFISNTTVAVSYYGDAAFTEIIPGTNIPLALAALGNGDFQPFQTYTNSLADISSYGATLGIDAKIIGDFDIGASYTYTELDFDQAAFPDF